VWNPLDRSITAIVDAMPIEIARGRSLTRAKMVSINKNTELVFFGGFLGDFYTEVWKYKYLNNSWELLGNIQNGRESPLAIPVIGLKCP